MVSSLRIPNVLRARIDKAAGEGKRSEWILEACRMRLDGINPSGRLQAAIDGVPYDEPAMFGSKLPDDPPRTAAGAAAHIAAKPDLQALRDICAGNGLKSTLVESLEHGLLETFEIPICGKTWWEDGEHYECLMDSGHKESKHGMRGMVRVIS